MQSFLTRGPGSSWGPGKLSKWKLTCHNIWVCEPKPRLCINSLPSTFLATCCSTLCVWSCHLAFAAMRITWDHDVFTGWMLSGETGVCSETSQRSVPVTAATGVHGYLCTVRQRPSQGEARPRPAVPAQEHQRAARVPEAARGRQR